MRTVATVFVAAVLSVVSSATTLRPAAAQGTIVMEGDAGSMPDAGGPMDGQAACGCRNTQSPPWHGTVAGDPCGPSCPAPNVFHADPCGQLEMKHNARQHGYILPPCFPRMHGFMTNGSWPTPRPISLPRCPNCGAQIEHGM